MVYPSDDRILRLRLLTKQARELRDKLRKQLDRARAACRDMRHTDDTRAARAGHGKPGKVA